MSGKVSRYLRLFMLVMGLGFISFQVLGTSIVPVLFLLLADENAGLYSAEKMTNLAASNAAAQPDSLTDHAGQIYFVDTGQLMRLDPDNKHVILVRDFMGGRVGDVGQPLHQRAAKLFFACENKGSFGAHDREPCYYNKATNQSGSDDLNGRGVDSLPAHYFDLDAEIYLIANTGNTERKWHYLADPIANPNNYTKPIFTDPIASEASNPVALTYRQNLYFSADDGINGAELWLKKQSNMELVADINAAGSSNPHAFTLFNDRLYFVARNSMGDAALWRYDAQQAKGIQNPKSIQSISEPIFSSTGTSTATSTATSTPIFMRTAAVSNELFVVDSQPNQDVLHRIDVNESVDVGGLALSPAGLSIQHIFEFKDELYLFASTPLLGMELWRYNATTKQVELLKDLAEGVGSSGPDLLSVGDDAFYFVANDGINGREIWRSDGSAVKTQLLADVHSGVGSADPTNFLLKDGWLYFVARDGSGVREIWRVSQ